METNSNYTTASLINLSSLTQYFIPFGSFIFPIIIWSSKKDSSEYVNQQGKQTINFQLSLFLYTLILALIAVPIFLTTLFKTINFEAVINNNENILLDNLTIENFSGLIIIAIVAVAILSFMKVAEFFLIIYASVQTSKGENFKYPFTIPFLK